MGLILSEPSMGLDFFFLRFQDSSMEDLKTWHVKLRRSGETTKGIVSLVLHFYKLAPMWENVPFHPKKTKISQSFCTVWSESSLVAWRNFASLAIQNASREDSDQTCQKVYFLTWQLIFEHPIHPITKTCLFKYTEDFTAKKWKFSDKKFWYFSYSCSKHRLGVLLRTASARTTVKENSVWNFRTFTILYLPRYMTLYSNYFS